MATLFGEIAGVSSFVIATVLAASGPVSAATVMLKDGAVIHGEVETLLDDVYTVKTESLGTLRVRKEDVRAIDYSDESPVGPVEPSSDASSPGQAELEAVQTRMLQNPNLLTMIQALQEDPEVQAVLSDPEIMSAIASGNYAAVMNHPKIIALTRNAKMRAIIDAAQ